jgi:CRP-like cAMP-binding protein
MKSSSLGKVFHEGEIIVRQGEPGDCMFVILNGEAEVLTERDGHEIHLATLRERDFFGEMALFERTVRSATVRAVGEVHVLTLEKKSFLRRVHEDPTLAFHLVKKMSQRIRELDEEISRLKNSMP